MAELSNVQPGDKLFECNSGFGCRSIRLHTVNKVGKLHITLMDGTKVNLRTGRRVGELDRWHRAWYRPYNEQEWQEYVQEQRDNGMRVSLREYDWQRADIELIRKVYELLPKPTEVR